MAENRGRPKTRRRGRGEGQIRKRSDGRWEGRYYDSNGRRRSVFATTQREALETLRQRLQALTKGEPDPNLRRTVGVQLTTWLESIEAEVSPRTFQRYKELVRLHLLPGLGRHSLARLQPDTLRSFYKEKVATGLAPRTVGHMHRVLHAALHQAEADKYIPRNVARLVKPPRVEHTEIPTLSPGQVRALLAAAEGTRFEALIWLAVFTGLRQGELLGLRWRNVNLDRGTITVVDNLQPIRGGGLQLRPPKTGKRSRRTIQLPEAVVLHLRAHRARQLEEKLKNRALWREGGFVFANEIGGPMLASNILRRHYRPLLVKAGLATQDAESKAISSAFNFHSLRHTAASLALDAGVPLIQVSQNLGHARTSTTSDMYGHDQGIAGAVGMTLSRVLGVEQVQKGSE